MLCRLSPYLLWGLLSLPPVYWTYTALTSTDPRISHILVHPTGEWAARLLIVTLLVSPLVLIFKRGAVIGWLRHNRRYLGVASFGYAALHLVFYIIDKGSLSTVIGQLGRTYIWTGWIAFAIFLPLAMTSMDAAMRAMGAHWKTLQRTTYLAALFTLLHWAALHDWGGTGVAMVHFGPLIVLEAYRLWYWTIKSAARRASA